MNITEDNISNKVNNASLVRTAQLKILHINIQGLNSSIIELEVMLAIQKPDVICITEHWIQSADEIQQVHLNNYQLISFSSRTNYIRGGTAVFVKLGLQATNKTIRTKSVDKNCEFCCTNLHTSNSVFNIFCIYRSPHGKVDEYFDIITNMLEEADSTKHSLIVCGDFNFHFNKEDENAIILTQLLKSHGLTSHIKGITRPASQNQLDNIFTNLNSEVTGIIDKTKISNHYCQIIHFKTDLPIKQKFGKKRYFTSSNINRFKEYLFSENWSDVFMANDANSIYNNFEKTFKYFFNLCFPLVTFRIKAKKKGWVTNEIREY